MEKPKRKFKLSFFKLSTLLILIVIALGIWHPKSIHIPQGEKSLPEGVQLPNNAVQYDMAVVGAGAAGSMAAYRGVLNNNTVLLAIGAKQEQRRSRGTWVPEIGNIPMFKGIKRPILYFRNVSIENIIDSPLKDNLFVLQDSIINIKQEEDGRFLLTDGQGTQHRAKSVILATGMTDEQPHIKGSIRPILKFANSQQAIYCLRCDGHLSVGKDSVAVIGYSNSAAQNAMLIKERYNPPKVSILTNGQQPTWPPELNEWLQRYDIEVYTKDIHRIYESDFNLSGFEFSDKKILHADFAVVNLGVRINNQLAKDLGVTLDETGYVLADDQGLTNIPGVYVAGDLRANTLKQVYWAWASAIASADAINRNLRLEKRAQYE